MSFQIVSRAALTVAAVLLASTPMPAQAPVARGFGLADGGLTAGRDFVAGEVIVGLHRGMPVTAAHTVAAAATGRVVRRIDGPQPVALVRFADEPHARQAVAALAKQPGVRFIERNGIVSIPPIPAAATKEGRPRVRPEPVAISTDPGTPYQWHLPVIRATAALGPLAASSPTIAIIDTGVDYTHPELSGKVIMGRNCVDDTRDPFDDHGHGTHVAGIAAAKAGNGVDGDGIASKSKVLAVKVLDSTGFGTFFDIACGLRYARTVTTSPAVRVGNFSIGGPESAAVAAEVEEWRKAGKILVAAAGNTNDTGNGTLNADPGFALRVMATEHNDCRASFSTFSPAADPTRFNIAAPGFAIVSTFPGTGFLMMDGTSMATPMVAAAAALVWAHEPGLTREAVIRRLVDSGKPVTCGFAAATRRLDVRRAVLRTSETAIVGRVLNGASGEAIASATASVQVLDGASILGGSVTSRGGSYEIVGGRLAGSGRKLRLSASGYITDEAIRRVTVATSPPTGPFTDAAMRQRGAGFFQVTVDWKTTQPDSAAAGARTMGWDLDLVLQPPGAREDWFGPGPAGDLARVPFYRVFRDSFNDTEPVESLAIAPRAADGTYRILVRRFSGPSGLDLGDSRAHVRLYDSDVPVMGVRATGCTARQSFWHVANVRKRGTSYTVTRVDRCRETPL
jgi:thermitase